MPSSTGSFYASSIARPQNGVTVVNIGLRDDGLSGWTMLAGTIAVAVAIAYAMASVVFGTVALLAVWLTAWRMFVPVEYEFGPLGVTERVFRRARRISWRHVAHVSIHKDGVTIVEDVERPFTNTFVRFAGKKQALLEVLDQFTELDIHLEHSNAEAPSENA